MYRPQPHQAGINPPGAAAQAAQAACAAQAAHFDGLGAADSGGWLAQEMRKNDQFVDLLNAFRPSGGLARVAEVAARFQMHRLQEESPLVGWISRREVVSFKWQSRVWLPLCQFNPMGLTLRAGLSDILAELPEVYSDWDVATWFACPNPLLAHRAPADMLAVAAAQVREAAQAERNMAAK